MVGSPQGTGIPAENNIYNFNGGSSPVSSCSVPGGAVEIENFELESDGEYEIADTFSQVSQGETIYITVLANFDNNEYINESRCITVGSNTQGYVNHAMVQIRGNIKDYSSSTVNYRVSIKVVP